MGAALPVHHFDSVHEGRFTTSRKCDAATQRTVTATYFLPHFTGLEGRHGHRARARRRVGEGTGAGRRRGAATDKAQAKGGAQEEKRSHDPKAGVFFDLVGLCLNVAPDPLPTLRAAAPQRGPEL